LLGKDAAGIVGVVHLSTLYDQSGKMQSINFDKECSGSRVDRNSNCKPDFSSESAALLYPSILCGNSEVRPQQALDEGQEHKRWRHHNLCIDEDRL
jgi:hypothetical protein